MKLYPDDHISIFVFTSPLRKYIGVPSYLVDSSKLDGVKATHYWRRFGTDISRESHSQALYLFHYIYLDLVCEKLVSPATVREKHIYLPRLEEKEWQRTNTIEKL